MVEAEVADVASAITREEEEKVAVLSRERSLPQSVRCSKSDRLLMRPISKLTGGSGGEDDLESEDSGETATLSQSQKRYQKRKLQKTKLQEEVASLQAKLAAAQKSADVEQPASQPADYSAQLLQAVNNLTEQIGQSGQSGKAAKSARAVTQPGGSPAKSSGSRISVKGSQIRRLIAEEAGQPTQPTNNSEEMLVFDDEDALRRFVKAQCVEVRAFTPSKKNPLEAYALATDNRAATVSTEIDAGGAMFRLVDWAAPDVKRDLLEALEEDAAARLKWKPIDPRQFEDAVSDFVADQAADLHQRPLHKQGKSDLLRILSELGVSSDHTEGKTAKQLLIMLLSILRVLPHSL